MTYEVQFRLALLDSDDHARAFLPVNRLEQEITTNSVLKHSGSEGKRVSSIASIEGSEFNFRCNALISSTEAPDLEDGQNNMECLLASICEAWWNGDTMEKGVSAQIARYESIADQCTTEYLNSIHHDASSKSIRTSARNVRSGQDGPSLKKAYAIQSATGSRPDPQSNIDGTSLGSCARVGTTS